MVIKKATLVLTTLLLTNTALASSDLNEEKTTNFIVTPFVAYRYDVFKWAIPSNNFPSKKVSELIWKNYIIQPGINIETEPTENSFTFLGYAKYGYILKNMSKSWDKDWHVYKQKSGKIISKQPYSNTLSSVKGNILDLSTAIGYSFNLLKNNLFIFYIGYDYIDYKNKIYGIRQIADNKNNLLYPFNQLISKYYFKMKSPWVGLSVNAPLNDKLSIIPTIKFYSFKYIGKGYWLLRDDLAQNPSLKHNAKGNGLGLDVNFLYKYTDNLDFKISVETKRFKMKKGQAQDFLLSDNNKKSTRVMKRNLFNLSLISSSISAGVRYKF